MTASIHAFCEIENNLTDKISEILKEYRLTYNKINEEFFDREAFEFDKKKLETINAGREYSLEQLDRLTLTKLIGELKIITTVNGERI